MEKNEIENINNMSNEQIMQAIGQLSIDQPSTIVNWCGDEVVTAEDWCALFGSHLNKTPQLIYEAVSGSQSGGAADPSLRKSITGPCSVSWVDGMSSFTQSHVK